MRHTIERGIGRTPLDELRSLTEQADARVGALERSSSGDAVALLRTLDDIDVVLRALEDAGVEPRAEEGRLETVRLSLQRKVGLFLRLLGPAGGLAKLRAARRPADDAWWWHLDAYQVEAQKRQIRGVLRGFGILAIIFLVGVILFNTVLRPDPVAVARLNYTQQAQSALDRNDLEGALLVMDRAVAEFPDDGEMLIWRGAILMRLGRVAETEAMFAAARTTYEDETAYLVQRSMTRLQALDAPGALADGQQAVAVSPDSAQAHLALGGAQEVSGQLSAALRSYSRAAELAGAQKNSQLEALAKVRLAMLMQAAPAFPQPTPQPQPTR